MIQFEQKFLPKAIYLDTNILRAAHHNLSQPWMSELRSLTNEYGISLCVTELVFKEWCEYIIEEVLRINYQKLESAMMLLKEYKISLPDFDKSSFRFPDEVQLVNVIRERLCDAGFEIIKNCDIPLGKLLDEAVQKCPPFSIGDKGFRDAILLESYALHASEKFYNQHVFVISEDKDVRKSKERFEQRGINVTFVGKNEVVDQLKSLFDEVVALFLKDRQERLVQFIKSKEKEILDFVRKSPLKFTDWWLQSFTSQDRIEGSIQRILSVNPTQIKRVIGGSPHFREQTAPGRYPVKIVVEIELEIVVSQYSTFSDFFQPRAISPPELINRDSPVTLENRIITSEPVEKIVTINRIIMVNATVDAINAEKGEYLDLRLESTS